MRDYFEIAEGTYLWRSLPAFTRNVTKRVVKHAKDYLCDSGLGHHALRVPDVTALLRHPQAGASWEGTFGLVAVEIKLGQRVRAQELRGLREFIADHHCRFGIVLSNEDKPRLMDVNIAGLPERHL